MGRAVGVDLGGTKVLAGAVRDGEIAAQAKLPTPSGGPRAVAAAVADLVGQVGGADHLAVGVPGQVRPDGRVVGAPNLVGWDESDWARGVPFGDLVAEALGLDHVRVENDANLHAVAEHRLGAGRGVDDLLLVAMGTGVGAGLILDGALRRGPHGSAAELGHTVFERDGRPCGCGSVDHVEAYAGRQALEVEARRRHQMGQPTALVELAGEGRMKSSVWAKALDRSDPVAVELIDQAVEAVGVAIANAVTLLDLSLVVVGGGLAGRLGPSFVGRIEQAARSHVISGSPVRVVPAALEDLSGVLGAALLAEPA